MFVGNTDPYPYIIAAYMVGTCGILGMTLWICKQRITLRKKLQGLQLDTKAE
jgi:hypothetical protein